MKPTHTYNTGQPLMHMQIQFSVTGENITMAIAGMLDYNSKQTAYRKIHRPKAINKKSVRDQVRADLWDYGQFGIDTSDERYDYKFMDEGLEIAKQLFPEFFIKHQS